MIEKAKEKLTQELEKEHNRMVPAVPILIYLINRVGEKEELAPRVLLENKTVKECFEYVLQEARKLLEGKSGWLDDQVVYDLAETYFMSDDIEIEKPKYTPPAKPTLPTQTVKKEVKEEKKEQQLSLF